VLGWVTTRMTDTDVIQGNDVLNACIEGAIDGMLHPAPGLTIPREPPYLPPVLSIASLVEFPVPPDLCETAWERYLWAERSFSQLRSITQEREDQARLQREEEAAGRELEQAEMDPEVQDRVAPDQNPPPAR
jgi:hypothetical protein